MGKIVKLKNKKTGVRVYPVTATSAVVDADSGERLNDSLKNKVEEAPMDGAQYVRKNGTWAIAEVSMDSNEICRINLKSNQGDADNSSLNGATVNVVNTVTGDVLYDGVWDGTEIQLSIPGATIYKVTVGDVADYKTPEAITIEATAFSSRDLIMTYQTEVVSVTLSSDNGVSVVGQVVTINGTAHTWNGTAISQKVAFGVSYSVSANSKAGYVTPLTQTFSASLKNRSVESIYKGDVLGVFIQDTEGALWDAENWDGSKTLNGIAVKTDSISLLVSLGTISGHLTTYSDGWPTTKKDITPVPDWETAVQLFNGENSTDKMYSLYSSESDSVIHAVKNFRFKDGTPGYIPSAGEGNVLVNNKDGISKIYAAMGYGYTTNIPTSTCKSNTTDGYYPVFYWDAAIPQNSYQGVSENNNINYYIVRRL